MGSIPTTCSTHYGDCSLDKTLFKSRVFKSRQSPHGKMKLPFFRILFIFGGTITMEKMIIENRIALLTNRDPIGNARIINKLKRRLRKLESK